jgi:fructoselysine-6-P-deglycase FrlB-like protein
MAPFQVDQFGEKLQPALRQIKDIISLAKRLAPNIDCIQMVSSGTGDSFMEKVILKWIDAEARDLEGYAYKSADYAISPPKRTNDRTLLIITSVSGTTDDAVLAVDAVRDRVHYTVAFVGPDQSPVADRANTTFTASGAVDPYVANCLLMQVFVGKFLQLKEGWGGMARLLNSLEHFPKAYVAAALESQKRAKEDAVRFKDHDKMMFVGAGYAEQLGFVTSDCNMAEKLKIHSAFVEASRFLHGPQEIVNNGFPVIHVLGEDQYQPLMGPVQKLCADHDVNTAVYSTREMKMAGIAPDIRPLFSPLVLRTTLKNLVAELAEVKGLDLNHRYFYGKGHYTVKEHGEFNL